MEQNKLIAEEILRKANNDSGGNLYPAQIDVSHEKLEEVFKILSPYGKYILGEQKGSSPIFQINDLGRAFVAQGAWSEKEKQEEISRKRHEEILFVSTKAKNISFWTLVVAIISAFISLFAIIS